MEKRSKFLSNSGAAKQLSETRIPDSILRFLLLGHNHNSLLDEKLEIHWEGCSSCTRRRPNSNFISFTAGERSKRVQLLLKILEGDVTTDVSIDACRSSGIYDVGKIRIDDS